jgi:post-segregation antitoxin (ccd killing protein)
MSQPEGTPKLIVDTDWKAQAEAEKQKLAAKLETPKPQPAKLEVDSDWKQQAEAEKAKLSAQSTEATSPAGARPADDSVRFEDLISMLVSQAMMYMGAIPDPRTGQAIVGLDYARIHIDMLAMLEEKTKGNLSPQEATLLQRVLSELRLEFVELSKAVEQAIAQGKIRPQAAGVSGGIKTAAPGAPKPPSSPTMTFNFPGPGGGAPGGR